MTSLNRRGASSILEAKLTQAIATIWGNKNKKIYSMLQDVVN